jgi:sodium-dependent dicarboxylate transporter 2/3/5
MKEKLGIKKFGLFLGILIFVLVLIFGIPGASAKIIYMSAIASLMAVWWITEAIPLSITSLLPVVLIPIFGIMSADDVSKEYFNSTIMMFLGGFLIALAMERWNLHKRISIKLIKAIGTSPPRIVLACMMSSGFISMFLSNTATTVMIFPIGLALIKHVEDLFPFEKTRNFSVAVMLGIAYAATIGGTATLIGTPPNLIFQRIYHMTFSNLEPISFAKWFIYAFPQAVILFTTAYLILIKIFFRPSKDLLLDKSMLEEEYIKLGKMKYEEKVVSIVFFITALLWIFRTDLDIGFINIRGWQSALNLGKNVDDGSVAITMAILLFILPAKQAKTKINDASIVLKAPWDVILLFGGGFALAKGFAVSGLSDFLGYQFDLLKDVKLLFLTAAINFMMTFLSEVTSNTAISNTVLPILASISKSNLMNPLILMLPATISVSMGFMLPVATPPNAIIYGSGKIRIGEMVKAGFVMNIVAIIINTIIFYLWGVFVFSINL